MGTGNEIFAFEVLPGSKVDVILHALGAGDCASSPDNSRQLANKRLRPRPLQAEAT